MDTSASTETEIAKPLVLYTAATPNAHRVSIYLEELKAAYPGTIDYEVRELMFLKMEQKQPWYLKINPNGRIPALVHRRADGTEFPIFESTAIMFYLRNLYDKERKFSFPADSDEDSEELQWILFSHGGLGPMQLQANWFNRYSPEKVDSAIQRYINETKRLYSVLENRLKDREYLVGPGKGIYSIADISSWTWVKSWSWSGLEGLDDFPALSAWVERIRQRPQAIAGIAIPSAPPPPKTKEEEEERAGEIKKWVREGKAYFKAPCTPEPFWG